MQRERKVYKNCGKLKMGMLLLQWFLLCSLIARVYVCVCGCVGKLHIVCLSADFFLYIAWHLPIDCIYLLVARVPIIRFLELTKK